VVWEDSDQRILRHAWNGTRFAQGGACSGLK
jgi:hypothetical protein